MVITAELICGSCGASHEMGRTKQIGTDIVFDLLLIFNGPMMLPCPMCNKTAWEVRVREWTAKPLPNAVKAIIDQAYRI